MHKSHYRRPKADDRLLRRAHHSDKVHQFFQLRGSFAFQGEEEARCLCCWTYCLMIADGAPPADPAK
jgi:hypothetical protein